MLFINKEVNKSKTYHMPKCQMKNLKSDSTCVKMILPKLKATPPRTLWKRSAGANPLPLAGVAGRLFL